MAPEYDFAGQLSFLNLGELLQLLGSSSATGILRVYSPFRSEPGKIVVEKGNPINATNGTLSGVEALFALFGWAEAGLSSPEKLWPTNAPSKKAGWKSFWMA